MHNICTTAPGANAAAYSLRGDGVWTGGVAKLVVALRDSIKGALEARTH